MSEQVGSIYYDLDLNDKRFNDKAAAASRKFDLLSDKAKESSKKVLAATGVVVTGFAGLALKALDSASKMETMGVALETALGGNKKAAQAAQKQITDFAAKTPFQLEEVMGAFVKLKNLGLNPSEKALTSYGNTASAMGKTLNDMVEAVADASTGEFERLKEFGIRSSKEKNKVKFTFQGVTTTVKNNAKDIENYLINLGNTKFAGGMEKQSQTLAGKLSTLKDTIELSLGELATKTGIFDIAKNLVQKLTDALSNLVPMVMKLPKLLKDNEPVVYAIGAALLTTLVPALWATAASIWATLAPLLPFLAIGALVGVLIYKLVQAFGGWNNLLAASKNAIRGLWETVGPILMPALQQLWTVIQTQLLPGLRDFWNFISPVLIPTLKVLGIVLGVVIVGATWLVIKAITLLISGLVLLGRYMSSQWEKGIQNVQLWWTKTKENIDKVGLKIIELISWFKSIPEKISNGLRGVYDAITKPFKDAFDWIKNNVEKAKNNLDKINPFHKESPSLVEWVTKGTDQITGIYEGMFNKLDQMSGVNRAGLVASAQAVGNVPGAIGKAPNQPATTNNVTLNSSGIIARSDGELRDIMVQGLKLVNQALIANGQKPMGAIEQLK